MRQPRAGRAVQAAVVALVAVLTGCGGVAGPSRVDVDPVPRHLGTPAAAADDADRQRLPEPFSETRVVRPGWLRAPDERDGLFLGPGPAEEQADAAEGGADSVVRFVAADSAGTVLWEADRTASAGFALSRAAGRPVAVLTDPRPADDGAERTTATGYDLATGRRIWGPVDVPGSLRGPGLVISPTGAEGGEGARAALDPATGSIAYTEDSARGLDLVGEYDGTLLVADDRQVTGLDASTREALWSHPRADVALGDGRVVAVPDTRTPTGTALVGAAGATQGTLLDVADGTVLARGVEDARRDAATGALVTVAGAEVSGRTADGTTWTRQLSGPARLAGAGGVLVYLRLGEGVQVLNAVTGKDASAYAPDTRGPLAVPTLFSADGAAVVAVEEYLLVTTQTDAG